MDPERALQKAVLGRLRAEPALVGVLGGSGRVCEQPPADAEAPYLSVGRIETRPLRAEGPTREHRVTLTCLSRFGGAEEARAVVGLARDTLDEAPLSLDGHRLVDMRATYSDVFRASDFRTVFGVLRLRAVTEPVAP